ncbi:MAG: hypothetical protein PF481_00655 [Bacteroidales bacterium]|nr:hypothetical protein [Bacteroidales bacterium]
MKKYSITLGLGLVALLFACSPAQQNKQELAEEYKQTCLADTMNTVIYGDDTENYCTCISSQIEVLPDSVELSEEKLEEIIQDCADEYTSLDTEF